MSWTDEQAAAGRAKGAAAMAIDPTAGVKLMPKRIYCPRCGVDKGPAASARRSPCRDCHDYLQGEPPAVRAAWRRAA